MEAFVDDKRGKMSRQDPSNNEPRRNCVICTVEERQISVALQVSISSNLSSSGCLCCIPDV